MIVAAPLTQVVSRCTVRALLDEAAATLPGDSPRLDAELLLAQVLGCPRAWLLAHGGDALPAGVRENCALLFARRVAGEPVAYILGQAPFWTLDLEVNRSTLVPRADTETLVENTLARWLKPNAHVLDLGAGSGAIALALARERPQWDVLGVDIDPEAVAVATRNATRNRIRNARFVAGCWFAPVAGMHFDLIVSNPPYIRADDPCLQGLGLRHEPVAALASGVDGLDALRIVVAGAVNHLLRDGMLACEHGADQAVSVRALFVGAGFSDVCTWRDLGGHERVTAGWMRGDVSSAVRETARHG